jgi:(1->4)-alpha-D-glucan 1-alpha-D-glucosylmutase
MLAAVKREAKPSASFASELAQHWEDGRIKLYAVWKALNFRRERSELFTKGDFLELTATGPHAEHILAILRHYKREWTLLVAPRWLARAQEERKGDADIPWRDARIELPDAAPQFWKNIFTGEKNSAGDHEQKSLAVGEMLIHFPIALLSSMKSSK